MPKTTCITVFDYTKMNTVAVSGMIQISSNLSYMAKVFNEMGIDIYSIWYVLARNNTLLKNNELYYLKYTYNLNVLVSALRQCHYCVKIEPFSINIYIDLIVTLA